MKLIVNATTGQEEYVELTEQDLAQQVIDEAAVKAEDEAKESNRIARINILQKLGLTEEEANILFS